MSPLGALGFLIGINKGGTVGGAMASILMNTPGSPEAAATAFDGHPLAKQGKALKALKIALYSSVSGDTFSDFVLIAVSAPLALAALRMGPPEMMAVMIFAMTIVASLVGKSMIKGLIAAVFGVLLSTIGLDPEGASDRLTFGVVDLLVQAQQHSLAMTRQSVPIKTQRVSAKVTSRELQLQKLQTVLLLVLTSFRYCRLEYLEILPLRLFSAPSSFTVSRQVRN